jgi:fumarylacetoacetase
MIDETHDPARRSWIESANLPGADFPIQNLPFGVFRRQGSADTPSIGVGIGDQILNLRVCNAARLLDDLPGVVLAAVTEATLNSVMALDRAALVRLRQTIARMLDVRTGQGAASCLVPIAEADMLLPAAIGDYTDFYASLFHAARVGELFRPDNPLLPNYKYLPIGYHGRASSIVPSGTSIVRPWGQLKAADEPAPQTGFTDRLDYELELGLFVRGGNPLGRAVPIAQADDQLFGLCIVNDWSARDIQVWESQPLGPFLAKSFATSISPWVVTYEALEPFRCPAFEREAQDPRPLPYLTSGENERRGGFDITVEAAVRTAAMATVKLPPQTLSRGSFRDMYWTPAQMIAHHTSNGCNLRPADLLASGTISGAQSGSEGCLLEMTRNGARAVALPDGSALRFLCDGDEVIMRAWCERAGFARIGFGECRGVITTGSDRPAEGSPPGGGSIVSGPGASGGTRGFA